MRTAASDGPARLRAWGVVRRTDGAVLALSGEFDITSRAVLREALRDSIAKTSDAVVDVRAVTFLDASTVGLFVEASRQAKSVGGQVRLVGASGFVERFLRLCGVWEGLAEAQPQAGQQPGLLAVAKVLSAVDRCVVLEEIISAATDVGAADACDLQIFDAATQSLRMAGHRGFTDEFLSYFDTVDATQPTACAAALATGRPVVIDDITRSPIFADRATLEVILASGTRAVQSYPLRDDRGSTLGVLSFHYHTCRPARGRPALAARRAPRALARLTAA